MKPVGFSNEVGRSNQRKRGWAGVLKPKTVLFSQPQNVLSAEGAATSIDPYSRSRRFSSSAYLNLLLRYILLFPPSTRPNLRSGCYYDWWRFPKCHSFESKQQGSGACFDDNLCFRGQGLVVVCGLGFELLTGVWSSGIDELGWCSSGLKVWNRFGVEFGCGSYGVVAVLFVVSGLWSRLGFENSCAVCGWCSSCPKVC
ncbi:hypothetical protein Droror1_Dr00027286 [Drosera rotundifolia]